MTRMTAGHAVCWRGRGCLRVSVAATVVALQHLLSRCMYAPAILGCRTPAVSPVGRCYPCPSHPLHRAALPSACLVTPAVHANAWGRPSGEGVTTESHLTGGGVVGVPSSEGGWAVNVVPGFRCIAG